MTIASPEYGEIAATWTNDEDRGFPEDTYRESTAPTEIAEEEYSAEAKDAKSSESAEILNFSPFILSRSQRGFQAE